MKDANKDGITLENLLRLKRLERPPAEFWTQFETELRAKQLAAIVAKRPWWQGTVDTILGLRRYHVPIAGAAALALAFVTVRDYHSNTPAEAYVPAAHPHLLAPSLTLPANAPASAAPVVKAITKEVVSSQPTTASVALAQPATVPTTLLPLLTGAPPEDDGSDTSLSPSARSIAVNLAAARAAQPEVARRLFDAPVSFEARALPAHETDPIARLDPASQERRDRLLGASVASAVASSALAPASDRLASRLSDDRLYEQISRYAGDGSRLSIKF